MAADIQIKGMVCERCISVVKEGIVNLGYHISKINLGRLTINESLHDESLRRIEDFLKEKGFALISNKQRRIVD